MLVAACLPWVAWWAWRTERSGRRRGRPLPEPVIDDARELGVRHPERVRVLVVDAVPMPGAGWQHSLAARFGFDGSLTAGLCLRYAIYLRRDAVAHHSSILRHELVHTAQFERLGGILPFLWRYLVECLRDGYQASALEIEAGATAGRDVDSAPVSEPACN